MSNEQTVVNGSNGYKLTIDRSKKFIDPNTPRAVHLSNGETTICIWKSETPDFEDKAELSRITRIKKPEEVDELVEEYKFRFEQVKLFLSQRQGLPKEESIWLAHCLLNFRGDNDFFRDEDHLYGLHSSNRFRGAESLMVFNTKFSNVTKRELAATLVSRICDDVGGSSLQLDINSLGTLLKVCENPELRKEIVEIITSRLFKPPILYGYLDAPSDKRKIERNRRKEVRKDSIESLLGACPELDRAIYPRKRKLLKSLREQAVGIRHAVATSFVPPSYKTKANTPTTETRTSRRQAQSR
jgi:hypothetical protein